MDDIQRKRILDNLDKLIHRTDYDKLAHACRAKGLLSVIMLQNLEKLEPDLCVNWTEDQKVHERHKRLFIKITKRGPTAYQELRMILADLKYDSALCLLNALDDSPARSLHQHHYHHRQQEKVNEHELTLPDTSETQILNTSGTTTTTTATVNVTISPSSTTTTTTTTAATTISSIESASSSATTTTRTTKTTMGNSNELENYSDHGYDDYISLDGKDTGHQRLEEFTSDIMGKPKSIIVKKSTHIHTHPKLATYPMKSAENRGIFFMVNIIDFISNGETRRGAEEDAKSLLHLFRELGFKLFPYKNLSRARFFSLLDTLLHSHYTLKTECFVMALMTHGTRDDDGFERVTFHDGSIVRVEEIERYFHNHVCPNLQNKPKIFIFPFCRGNIADSGVRERVQTDSGFFRSTKSNIPQLSDVFICYAASPGFRSHRDITEGSWYIQKFVEMMAEHASDTSFEEIVKMVQAETAKLRTVEGHLQTANSVNMGFNKALYFNPGVYEI